MDFEPESSGKDTRNKRGTKIEGTLNSKGGGLCLVKKSTNFKEMAKAMKR